MAKENIELLFKDMLPEDKLEWAEEMFRPIESAEELKDWAFTFLGLDMPIGHIDPDSTSSPVEAMWTIYDAIKHNKGDVLSGLILLSARAAYKTLGVSILEVLCMLHFRVTIAHMAAIREQSHQSISYMNLFFTKIDPLLEAVGWVKTNENKNLIEYRTPNNESVYIKIIVCTPAGANSAHTNILCVAEGSFITVKNNGLTPSKRHRIKLTAGTINNLLAEGKKVEALTFNHNNGSLEFKPITAAYKSHKPILNIKTESGRILRVSGDHPVYVSQKGYVQAKDLSVGDTVVKLSKASTYGEGRDHTVAEHYEPIITPESEYLEQVLIGSLLGDGGCYRKPKSNAYFAEQHGVKQKDYLMWKAEILKREFRVTETLGYSGYRDAKDMPKIYTGNSEKLNKYSDFRKTLEGVERLNSLGLAIWFMDDGSGNQASFCINSQSFTKEQNEMLAGLLVRKFGLEVRAEPYYKNDKVYWCIAGTAKSLYKMYKLCEPYWHPTMLYKFKKILEKQEYTCRYCGVKYTRSSTQYLNTVICTSAECEALYNDRIHTDKIVEIKQGKNWACLDFTVKDNHNFFADSILVHNCVDEIDVISNPIAYDEAKRIPTYTKGRHPITIKLSTRKTPAGLMQRELDSAGTTGEKILRWNILDISERCEDSRHRPEEPKEDRYVAKELPLKQISTEEYGVLSSSEQINYELVPQAFAGCKTCILLPVCKTRLAKRPKSDMGGLYRPVSAIINEFKTTPPDMAVAQLLCLRPSTKGMVYPRFENTIDKGNVLSLDKAYEILIGDTPRVPVSEEALLSILKSLKISFYAGVDWGYTHNFSIVMFAVLPNSEIWIVDCFSAPGLEFSDQLEIAKSLRDKYQPIKWFCDQALPASIKSFNKNGLKSPKFQKDVMGGIEALRSKICDSTGRRLLKVLNTKNCQTVITTFTKHCFKTDQVGNPTMVPDDVPGVADEADSMRYVAQNLFPVKGTYRPSITSAIGGQGSNAVVENQFSEEQHEVMARELAKATGGPIVKGGKTGRGGFRFSW